MSVDDGRWTITESGEVRHITTATELDEALDAIHERATDQHCLATIRSPAGDELLIGLGGYLSVLQFTHDDNPPYWVTVGDPEAEGITAFVFEGQETEILRRNLVPPEDARHAAVVFFESGVMPRSVRWEEV
ncbi:MAG: Imm1 family immunity protein [Candidatus Dormiibacterota bacterium]